MTVVLEMTVTVDKSQLAHYCRGKQRPSLFGWTDYGPGAELIFWRTDPQKPLESGHVFKFCPWCGVAIDRIPDEAKE